MKPISKILIANRAEIACRIIRTCKRLGIQTVAIYSSVDQKAMHVRLADQAVALGAAESRDSYLAIDKILRACKNSGADALHPGYGFLSENGDFAEALDQNGVRFIGPKAETIRLLGDKLRAKEAAEKAAVPLVPGISLDLASADSISAVSKFAKKVGYPLIIKAAAGGGGRGMRRINTDSEIGPALQAASKEAQSFFSDGRVFVEKLIENARHIEVQIFGDSHGEVMHLFDRDCSMQRNHQKVIEEAPAPNLPPELRASIHQAALNLCKSVGYLSAGTVEFLLDRSGKFYFLEVNSRLQVEHPVTEAICGLDLVELQIRIAQGEKLSQIVPLKKLQSQGAAIECRICAEVPEQAFVAATGRLKALRFNQDQNCRFDTGFEAGSHISHYYDSLMGKLIVKAETRSQAVELSLKAIENGQVFGVRNNLGFLSRLLSSPEFAEVQHQINFAATLTGEDSSLNARILALGLSVIYELESSSKSPDAWQRADHFRLFGAAEIVSNKLVNGQALSCSIKKLASKSYQICEAASGTILSIIVRQASDLQLAFKLDGKDLTASLNPELDWIQGRFGSYELLHFQPRLRGDKNEKSALRNEICSALPGKLLSLKVKAGQKVKAGEALLSIESMKMEHIIKAQADAKVTELCVAEGDLIEAGRLLLKLDFQ